MIRTAMLVAAACALAAQGEPRHEFQIRAGYSPDGIDDQGRVLGAFRERPSRPVAPGRIVRGDVKEDVAVHEHAPARAQARLRPAEQVEAILRAHPEVAAAAKVYPLGMESLTAARPAEAKPGAGAGAGVGFGRSGSGSASNERLFAAMMAANRRDPTAVPHLMDEARHLYDRDTDSRDPNRAPRAFWPSCHAYKMAMYYAGKILGKDAERLLAEIPDPDFVLLSAIELGAGALGLPPHFGVRMEHRPR